MIITLKKLALHGLYERMLEEPTTANARAVIAESCRMGREEDLVEELHAMLLTALSSEDIPTGEDRYQMIFLYECLRVLLKAVYVLDREGTSNREVVAGDTGR